MDCKWLLLTRRGAHDGQALSEINLTTSTQGQLLNKKASDSVFNTSFQEPLKDFSQLYPAGHISYFSSFRVVGGLMFERFLHRKCFRL